MAERYDNSRGDGNGRRRAPSRAAAARARVGHVSLLRKILMTMMVLGAVSTAVGAGTFASLSATTTQQTSTFQSGSIVLSDQVASGTACLSNAAAASTDTNNNANCDIMFDSIGNMVTPNANDKRPGESASVVMHLQNAGSLAGTLSVNSANDCTDTDPLDQAYPYGTTSGCNTVQLAIQDSTTCYYGDNQTTTGQAPYITSAPLGSSTSATVDLSTYHLFKITVNGVTFDNRSITAGTYTLTNLVTAMNTALSSTNATASLVQSTDSNSPIFGQYMLRITSSSTLSSANITLNIPTTTPQFTALSTLGFMAGANASGPGKCATLTGDQDHSLARFRATYAGTPLTLGAITASTTRDFTVTTSVPGVISSNAQARVAGFELTWNLTQS